MRTSTARRRLYTGRKWWQPRGRVRQSWCKWCKVRYMYMSTYHPERYCGCAFARQARTKNVACTCTGSRAEGTHHDDCHHS
jgi:hypothetical protein